MTFHGKTHTNGYPLNGLKRSFTVQKALKRLRKALEAFEKLLEFSSMPFEAFKKKRSKFVSMPLKALGKSFEKLFEIHVRTGNE